ncbi:7SK snRNA methylphosphate capping enzyme [Mauremys reevesii]|uniref:7SK snRNA methylphosphate capping enzyme n=1 Tax=Mauremys reevesii TaxID=260615 RepID=UPI00193EED59|nr:7SK snRNA methylphosphate capping enzyme [Mauremys reevesii]
MRHPEAWAERMRVGGPGGAKAAEEGDGGCAAGATRMRRRSPWRRRRRRSWSRPRRRPSSPRPRRGEGAAPWCSCTRRPPRRSCTRRPPRPISAGQGRGAAARGGGPWCSCTRGRPLGQRRGGGGGPPQGAAPKEEDEGVGELLLPRPRNGFQPPRPGGKRRNSCTVGAKHPAAKRRRRVTSECDPVLPSEFLLGGNIFDPLNLNSLLDEEVNQALNAETPKSSPLPARGRDPVEILIPKDITDPLSLNARDGDDAALVLASPFKAGRKRHRHRGGQQRGGGGGAGDCKPAACKACDAACPTPQPYELNTAINCRDEVVSPLLPLAAEGSGCVTPSGATGGRHHHRKRRRTSSKSEAAGGPKLPPPPPTPGGGKGGGQPGKGSPEKGKGAGRHQQAPAAKRRRQQRKFQYGNYCKYYGYRNPNCEDARLRVMKPEWFQGKEVLDLGCNVGHLTLSVAKKWKPARVVGLDIDGGLIHSARQNIRHYLSEEIRQRQDAAEAGAGPTRRRGGFPASLAASRGPIAAPRVPQDGAGAADFPDNVIFVRVRGLGRVGGEGPTFGGAAGVGSSRPPSCAQREVTQQPGGPRHAPFLDVVLCLSLTKWVHLNWGDDGLKRLFKRIFRHLRPGGLLLLEPQPWSSYGKRKNLTETIYRNYYRIQLKPEQFPSYLTSPEVGFSSCELVARPYNSSRGFQRPIYLLHKGHPAAH